jgi:hypothetical protein
MFIMIACLIDFVPQGRKTNMNCLLRVLTSSIPAYSLITIMGRCISLLMFVVYIHFTKFKDFSMSEKVLVKITSKRKYVNGSKTSI